MTVETTSVFAGPYTTDGVATAFPFDFKALSADEVRIEIDGAVVSSSLYTVQVAAQSGTATFTAPPAAGGVLYVISDPDFRQGISFSNQAAFLPTSHNEANDRAAVRDQVLKEGLDRSFQVPIAGGVDGMFPVVLPGGGTGFASGTGSDPALRTDLASSDAGASLVNFDDRDVDTKLRETVSVTDGRFGAKGDGTTDDTAAINAALAQGGRIIFPRGTYKITDRLLVTVSRTAMVLEAGTLITGNPWRYAGAQLPFGSFVLITAPDCSVEGAGMGLSTIRLSGGSEANAITFLHTDGGSVSGLTLDGGRSGVTAIEDDTFQTGINVLNATGGNPSGKWSRVQITAVEACNWTQYGMQAYGDLAGPEFSKCWVHDNGITDQPISRGAGIAVTRGNRGVVVQRCTIESNKQDGIFQTSAGLSSFDLRFSDNLIRNNGRWGISCTEEANFASIANVGTNGLLLTGNTIRNNGAGTFDSKGGLRIGTYDNVGIMMQVTAAGGIIQDNFGYGVLIQTNDNPTSRTINVDVDISVTGNLLGGIAIGAKLDDTVRWNSSKSRGNTGPDVSNVGDGRLISNARGLGVNVASASTITLPIAGDVFIITGSTNIANITAAGNVGRRVTLIFGGSLTVATSGNIVMLADWVAGGNDTLELVCAGASWIKTGGEHNV